MAPKRESSDRDSNPNIPKDVLETIHRAWPDGIISGVVEEDSWFSKVQDRLERKLRSVNGAPVVYERAASVERKFFDEEDDEFPDDSWQEEIRSYHLYFLKPEGEEFHYETEEEPLDSGDDEEDEQEQIGMNENGMIRGEGDIGLAVGISLVAPVGMVVPMRLEYFENGDRSDPALDFGVEQIEDGTLVSYLEDFHDSLTEEALSKLEKLKAKITGMLEAAGVRVLGQSEWEQPTPWLHAEEEYAIYDFVTVKDAFFYRDLI